MAIYLKLNRKPRTVSELLRKLFSAQSVFYVGIKSVATYYDSDCKQEQCKIGLLRSVDDIVEIAQTYFPNILERDIFRALFKLKLKKNDEIHRMRMINCSLLNKPTTFFVKSLNVDPCHAIGAGMYSYDTRKSKYKNWATVCKIADITLEQLETI